ncbi:MAG: hypothetical protein WD402_07040 [Chloroflexota bacterium]
MLFFALFLASLFVASRITSEIGIADPEREQFALLQSLLFGAAMLFIVPFVGRRLGQSLLTWPGIVFVLPFALAALANYLIFEDVRSGSYFETDHAMPEIFIPLAVVLLASARVGRRVAVHPTARRRWFLLSAVVAGAVLILVAMAFGKAATDSGDFELDSPATILTLAIIAAYAVSAIVGDRLRARRR